MPRSLKKGPYIFHKLIEKVVAMKESNKKSVIKTWSRASMIIPDMVGLKIWLVISWVNFLQLVTIKVTRATVRSNHLY
jgi:ribosomal protein S19